MTLSQIEQAAFNNAALCDLVCRAHGISGEFNDAIWINRHPVPRFYSNAITLLGQQAAATQVSLIRDLIDSDLPDRWSVKDSFYTLDLTNLGFQVLFEATWLWRSAAPVNPSGTNTGAQWTWVSDASELAQWEAAWSDEPTNQSLTRQPRIFLPALLADQNIGILAGHQDETIIAGAIANRTGEVVGLSNVFAPATNRDLYWAECVAAVGERFPGLPFVGYERGPDLVIAQAVGFERLQDLRVWIRKGS